VTTGNHVEHCFVSVVAGLARLSGSVASAFRILTIMVSISDRKLGFFHFPSFGVVRFGLVEVETSLTRFRVWLVREQF
jgi:hypothetical protein